MCRRGVSIPTPVHTARRQEVKGQSDKGKEVGMQLELCIKQTQLSVRKAWGRILAQVKTIHTKFMLEYQTESFQMVKTFTISAEE